MTVPQNSRFVGSIAEVANNPHGLYEGDLRYYVRKIFAAPNIHHGYHGLRHMLHVTWVCYKAIQYYAERGELTPRQRRNLLIGGLYHDYNHTGIKGDDAVNIARAIAGMMAHLLPEDMPYADEIASIIRPTQFPPLLLENPTLEQLILRDADMTQVFGPVWIGDIIAGFGSELGKDSLAMFEQQLMFLKGVRFHTDFGREEYGQGAVEQKIWETEALYNILTAA